MLTFVVRRVMLAIPVLFGLLALTFVLVRMAPSDPAAVLAGEAATPQQIEQIRKSYGLDRPLPEQFVLYIGQVLRGDLGNSFQTQRPVISDLLSRLPATIELALFAMTLAVLFGVPLGVVAAAYHGTPVDQGVRVTTVAGLAIASFWMGIMLQILFSMKLGLLPVRGRIANPVLAPPFVTGLYLIDSLVAGKPALFLESLRHLILPGFALALSPMASIARFTRSGVLESLQKDYVLYETAVGYPRRTILAKYVLRNSVVSTVTQIGLLLGGVLSSGVVIETIFDWPGVGSYAVVSIISSDYNAMLATVLVIGVAYALINIVIDIVHALIDPRVREQL
jgi:peptide/nickel transport system permease protein